MALPELIDDAIAEIILRLPPDEPACLVRASLVCKSWRRLLSDPAFLRRYRRFHRAPPLLGFLRNLYDGYPLFRFVPTATASPLAAPVFDGRDRWAVECRHGRALLNIFALRGLTVWVPVTGEQHPVPAPVHPHYHYTAAVLCGFDGCDHLDCHGGPFRVVFVGSEDDGATWASVYSSQTRAWGACSSIVLEFHVEAWPSLLVGEALHFMAFQGMSILRCDLDGMGLSEIDVPDEYGDMNVDETPSVMMTEDGRLGFAAVEAGRLYLWAWQEAGADTTAGWKQCRVVELSALLPIPDTPAASVGVVGFVENTDTIFLSTNVGIFTLKIKSGQVTKVGKKAPYFAVIPYTGFYSP